MYFFISRIVNYFFYNQVILLIILLIICFLLYRYQRPYRWLKVFIFIYFTILALIPTGTILLYSLEKDFHNYNLPNLKIDGILVLSGREAINKTSDYGHIYSESSTYRILESLRIQKKYPNAKMIFSGGSNDLFKNEVSTEVAEVFYKEFSLNYENISFDSSSTDTYLNIINAKKIANPKPDENWIVITSAFHMHRTLGIASEIEWILIPYPVDFRLSKNLYSEIVGLNIMNNINNFQLATHEFLGILIYKILGRSS